MIRVQTWEPDTHDAVFTCQWDDSDPEAPHVCTHAIVKGVESPDPQAAYDTVLTENRLKNQAVGLVLENMPDTYKKDVLDSDGDPTGERVVKDKHQPVGYFGAVDGIVSVEVPGADAALKEALKTKLAEQFGAAVVLIED